MLASVHLNSWSVFMRFFSSTLFPILLLAQFALADPSQTDATVKRYCIGCHNDKNKTANLSLSGMESATIGESAGTWEKVLRKMRTGEMPPLGMPHPEATQQKAVVSWLEAELDRNALAKPNPGTPSIHRLNRAEYANAIRDLLAIDLDNAASLPTDDSGYGFDNIGEVLTFSPLLMEKYMATGRRLSRNALGTLKLSAAIDKIKPARGASAEASDELPLSVRDGALVRRYFPADAEYVILVRVTGNPSAAAPPAQLDLRLDGKRVKLFDVKIDQAEEAQGTRNYEIKMAVKAGPHVIGAGFLRETPKTEGVATAGRRGQGAPQITSTFIDYVQIAGPMNATGPGDTESRRLVFVCRPAAGQSEAPCAKKIISTMARRAYRRPVTASDIDPLMKLIAVGRKDGGSFDAGIETALRAILVSPSFLFRVESNPTGALPGSINKVTDLELASRLSFFLWSSIPDEELLRLAEQKKLRPVLAAQVQRMLADPKSKALVENFAGQWLRLRNIADWKPDPDKFPQFDEPLKKALQKETELFFSYIVREDRSVLELLNADYTFLNERLAKHYGIPNVKGSYFRRVGLQGDERGGILTQGSVLTVTSYPTRTSPVLRGKWILESVLGAPPPPPPPDVPTLKETSAKSAKDLRAALEAHRANAACASCHSRLDPLGFALENYDAIGKFRASEDGAEVDASGQMPGGAAFKGSPGLKKILLERQDEFVDCLTEKLLTYALGRGLEHYDLPTVREIRRQTARADYRFAALAQAIANSVPFEQRRTPAR